MRPSSCNCPIYFMTLSRLKQVLISFIACLNISDGCETWEKSAQGWEHNEKQMYCKFYGERNETDGQVDRLPYRATWHIKQIDQNTMLSLITRSYHNNASTLGKLTLVHWFPHPFPWISSPQYLNVVAILSLNIKLAEYPVWPSKWPAIVYRIKVVRK